MLTNDWCDYIISEHFAEILISITIQNKIKMEANFCYIEL